VKCKEGFLLKKIGFALLALLLLSPAHSLTLSTIRTEVRVRIKDANASRQRYTDAQLNSIINQTQRDVVNFTWIIRKNTSIELVSGTTYYTLPTDIIHIDRVTWRRRNVPEQTLQSLDSTAQFGDWQIAGGPPQSYFQDPTQSTKIGIQPWPNSSSSTGTVVVNYVSQATDLSSDSDVPFNAETRYYPWHDLLIYEPAYKIMLIEGEYQRAAEYRSYFETRLKSMMDNLGRKDNYIPGFSGPNPR